MTPPASRRQRRRSSRARRRRTAAAILGAVVVSAAAVTAALVVIPPLVSAEPAAAEPTTSVTPTPAPTPLTPAQELLASTADPHACAVSFAGDGLMLDPMLQTQGLLYADLPIPVRPGAVFAGWYPSRDAAASLDETVRVNGSQLVVCEEREILLHGAWTTPEQSAAAGTRVPILMYHQFTTKPEGEAGWLKGNYAYLADFEAHMAYIAAQGFYLPTWDELSAFIDGTLHLPPRSLIITDDDGDSTWLELAVPVVTKHRLLTTSFVITESRTQGTPSPYVLQRSHTHDMHEAGANGKGRMVNWTADEIAADLETSAGILGVKEVVAYPFGHYNDTTKQGTQQAGFLLGRSIEWGYVTPGTDRYALPVIRMNYGDTVDDLAERVG